MAYTKQDVIAALADPILYKISIIFDSLAINGGGFVMVQNQIAAGNIQVVEGNSSANAYYNMGDDTLTTPGRGIAGTILEKISANSRMRACAHRSLQIHDDRTYERAIVLYNASRVRSDVRSGLQIQLEYRACRRF